MKLPCPAGDTARKDNTELNVGAIRRMRNESILRTLRGEGGLWTRRERREVAERTTRHFGGYQVTDCVEETSIDPYLTEAAQVLGEQAGSTIDILVRNVMAAGTNINSWVTLAA